MSMLLGIGAIRDLEIDLDIIVQADKLAECEDRLGKAKFAWREWSRNEASDERRHFRRLAELLVEFLGTDEYRPSALTAADDLASWQSTCERTIRAFAREIRGAARDA